jgi:hypothetical protein
MATIVVHLIIPKWRKCVVLASIRVLAAGYHLGVLSADQVDACIDPLSNWFASGIRVK